MRKLAFLMLICSGLAHGQTAVTVTVPNVAQLAAAQAWCQFYYNLGTTPNAAQMQQCVATLWIRAVQAYSVSSQGAAVTAVPFAPN